MVGLLWAFNGYVTIAGLVLAGVGNVVRFVDEDTGSAMAQWGWIASGLGATRKGVKVRKGVTP